MHASPATAILAIRDLPATNQRRTLHAVADFGRCHRPSSTVKTVELAGLCSLHHPTRRLNSVERFMPAPTAVWLIGWLVSCSEWLVFFGWLVDRFFRWLACRVVGWFIGWFVIWLAGWLVSCLVGWLDGYLICWLDNWLFGWLVSELVVWMIDWLDG